MLISCLLIQTVLLIKSSQRCLWRIFEIQTYVWFKKLSMFFHTVNEGVIGKLKDEFIKILINKFIRLKSKMWVFQLSVTNTKMFFLMKK